MTETNVDKNTTNHEASKSKIQEHDQGHHNEVPVSDPLVEMTDLLKRTQANFENYRKQTEKRIAEIQQMAAKDVILQLLPLIDNFELALKNAAHHEEFVNGVKLIYAQLYAILEEQGAKPIMTAGQQFSPYQHEALLRAESDLPEGKIMEEFQKGFTLHGAVIRQARVRISAGKKNTEVTGNKEQHQQSTENKR